MPNTAYIYACQLQRSGHPIPLPTHLLSTLAAADVLNCTCTNSMLPLRTSITMALSSYRVPRPTFLSAFPSKPHLRLPPSFSITFQLPRLVLPERNLSLLLARSTDESVSAAVDKNLDKKEEVALASPPLETEEKKHRDHHRNVIVEVDETSVVRSQTVQFKDPRWVGGTWDLNQFIRDGRTDWDAVIQSEARRRKWLQDNPETSSNDELVVFNTSVIPWWAWMKNFHLPEAEKLNGRAAMVGFFMAYFIDGLTGMGVVDQLGNFFCKIMLLLAVMWVLLLRENKDIENLKKLFEETTLYDKQWQATWQVDSSEGPKK